MTRLQVKLSARELLNEVIYTRTTFRRLYLILSTRYRVLAEQTSNPTMSANIQDLFLAPHDCDSIYSPTNSFFDSSVLAHGTYAILSEHALHVRARLHPRRGAPPSPFLASDSLTPRARRIQARQLRPRPVATAEAPAAPGHRGGAGKERGRGGGGGDVGGPGGGGGGGGGNRNRDDALTGGHPRGGVQLALICPLTPSQ